MAQNLTLTQSLLRCAASLAARQPASCSRMTSLLPRYPTAKRVSMATAAGCCGCSPSRQIATSAALWKVPKQKQAKLQKAAAAAATQSADSVSNQQLLQRIQYDKLTASVEAELASFQETLFRNLRLQITPDVLHDLEVATGGRRVPLGSLADVYQRSSDATLVVDLGANRAALTDVRQALSLKGFSGREQADADCIFVALPRVTTEHRRRLAANGRDLLSKAKLALKRLLDAAGKRLKEAERGGAGGSYSADDLRACQRLLVALGKRANAQAEAAMAAKERELLGGGGGGDV